MEQFVIHVGVECIAINVVLAFDYLSHKISTLTVLAKTVKQLPTNEL
ncbi:hypothetical protein ACQKMN_09855 [Ureibacillus composti]